MYLRKILCIVSIIKLTSLWAFALTMDEALQHAWNNNPALLSARSSLKAAEQNIRIARADFLPQITASGSVSATSFEGTGPASDLSGERYTTDGGINMSQNIINVANNYNLSATKYGIEAGRAQLENTEQGLLLEVINYYVAVARDTAVYALQSHYEGLTQQQYQAVKAQVDVGELTPTDQYLSEATWRGATAGKVSSLASLNTSKGQFLKVIGLEPKEMRRPYLPKNLPQTLEEATDEAQAKNPLVIAAEQQLLQDEELYKKAKAQRLPTVSANVGTQYSNDFDVDGILTAGSDGFSSRASVDVNVPIFQGGRIDAQIDAARANYIASEKTLIDTKNMVKQQITANWESYRAAKQQVAAYLSQIEAQKLSANGVREEFKVGTRSLIDLLDEDARLVTARVNYENAKANEVLAAWSLLKTMGSLTPSTLGLDR